MRRRAASENGSATVLRELRTVIGSPQAGGAQESYRTTLRALWRKPTYRYTLIGLTLYGFFAHGVLIFVPTYMVRVLNVNMALVGGAYGTACRVKTGSAMSAQVPWLAR